MGQNCGELIPCIGRFTAASLFDNLCHLGVGEPRMGVHNRFVKLVFGDITFSVNLHFTDHTQAIFCGI